MEEMKQGYADLEAELEEIKGKDFQFLPVDYVVCMDTLGQDRTLSIEDREQLENIV